MLTIARSFSPALRTVLVAGALSIALSACGGTRWGFPYKSDVQQGNWITSEQVAQLRPGMTRDQVRFLLGTPTLQDVLRDDRWDYPYYNKPGYGEEQLRRFTVWFDQDQVRRWEGDQQPDRQPFQRADTGMAGNTESGSVKPPEAPKPEEARIGNVEVQAVDPEALPMPGEPVVEPLR